MTLNFFTQDRTYQLLHAAVDDQKQSVFQKNELGDQDVPQLLSDQYKYNKYKLHDKSNPHLTMSKLDRPVIMDGANIYEDLNAKEDNTISFVDFIKAIFYIVVFVFRVLTCSGNFAQRKQQTLRRLRKPTAQKPLRQPLRINGQPVKEEIDIDNTVWQLRVWNYTHIEKTVFCFFSPVQVLIVSLCSILYPNAEYFVTFILLCQAFAIHFLVKQYEKKQGDEKLIAAEVFHEQAIHTERMLNANRKAITHYFHKHPSFGTTLYDSANTSVDNVINETHYTPPRVVIVTPPQTVVTTTQEIRNDYDRRDVTEPITRGTTRKKEEQAAPSHVDREPQVSSRPNEFQRASRRKTNVHK
ncbi:mutM [Acrasis kona]|uniref:MutM n=1 Tax=Acrasis kona TaxID=1008807 RepID=A0AAW2YJN7_9EUKA